jgi:hypothetical protein
MTHDMSQKVPSPTGDNGGGRDGRGRFTTGNRQAKGNPHARRVGRLRSALLGALTVADMTEIAGRLVAQAKQGDLAATRELFSRVLGPPVPPDLIERIESLERALQEQAP